jgi:hypothetical protein
MFRFRYYEVILIGQWKSINAMNVDVELSRLKTN